MTEPSEDDGLSEDDGALEESRCLKDDRLSEDDRLSGAAHSKRLPACLSPAAAIGREHSMQSRGSRQNAGAFHAEIIRSIRFYSLAAAFLPFSGGAVEHLLLNGTKVENFPVLYGKKGPYSCL